ncbi:MAG: type II secretion system F family protein [bacterium]
MPIFEYQAKAAPGETVRGQLQAESADALTLHLTELGLYPLEISPLQEDQVLRHGRRTILSRRPARAAVIVFTRQMANMLEAGMTVHGALHVLQNQTQESPLQGVFRDLAHRLRDGYKFSDACAAWPKVFSKFYVNMIRSGETGGMLELVLGHLADYLEKEDDVRKQVNAALAYPVLMFSMGALTVTVLLAFVIPRIVSMFDDMGQALPLPTQILVSVSHFTSQYWTAIAFVAGGLIVVFKMIQARPDFKQKLDQLKLRLPLLGSLNVQAEITQFARTLSALLTHGVPVHRAFEVVVAACKNSILQEAFQQVAESVQRGGRIGESLLEVKKFPPLLGQMISVAEETNQLENALEKIAQSGTREVERRVAMLTRLMEPALILLLGLVIGFIVFAMMMPILQMDFMVQ